MICEGTISYVKLRRVKALFKTDNRSRTSFSKSGTLISSERSRPCLRKVSRSSVMPKLFATGREKKTSSAQDANVKYPSGEDGVCRG